MKFKCFVLALFAAAPWPALAQSDYPTKPIRLIVGFTPGGISDVLSRAIAARLSTALGQQVIVENRPGAGTTIASELVAKSAPDGYTLMFQDITTHAINVSLYKKLPYDAVKDFTPITLVASTPLILVVHPSLPVKNVKELIALAKSKPGEIAYASSGNGTILHLAGESFQTQSGTKMIHVPYKGSAPAVQALLSGEVALTFGTTPAVIPSFKAGRVKALGVTTAKRVPGLDIPTIAEGGLPKFEIVLYSGVLGPAGLPPAIVNRLNAELTKVVNMPEMKDVYNNLGAQPMTNTPEQFAAHIKSEITKLGVAVTASGAKLD